QRPVPGARTRRTTVLRAIRGARGGCEGPRRVRSCRTRESKGRESVLLHVRPGRGIHPQGTCGDQFAVRLYHRGETRDRCRHAYPAISEGADAQGGLTQLRTSGERRLLGALCEVLLLGTALMAEADSGPFMTSGPAPMGHLWRSHCPLGSPNSQSRGRSEGTYGFGDGHLLQVGCPRPANRPRAEWWAQPADYCRTTVMLGPTAR